MDLEGQGGERGYAMAALLVSIAVMSVLMSAILPAWRQQAQREKEAELAFRGEQYARAIYLYQAKFRTAPPSVDVLVEQRFLRRKYKDPMTKDGEFLLLYAGANLQPGMPQTGQPGAVQGGRSPSAPRTAEPQIQGPGGMTRDPQGGQGGTTGGGIGGVVGGGPAGGIVGGGIGVGGIMGVQSKSKEASIRIYRGATHYNEWRFFYNAPGRGGPGQRGMPGMGPGGQPFPGGPGFPGPGGGRGRGNFPGGPGRGRGMGPGGMGPGGRGPGGGQPIVR